MRVMCDSLGSSFGATLTGDISQVDFNVTMGNINIHVDWDQLANNGYSISDVQSSGALTLAAAVADAIQVWYNVSQDLPSCIDWQGVYSSKRRSSGVSRMRPPKDMLKLKLKDDLPLSASRPTSVTCTASKADMTATNAWNALTCNEGINLVNW